MSSRLEGPITLVGGPLDGEVYDAWLGRWLIVPEAQRCDQHGCLVYHWITHQYDFDGTWVRSFTALCPPWQFPELEGAPEERQVGEWWEMLPERAPA
jgi:hypothetical protein